jgi:uncharacterized protein DUF4416
MGIRRERRAAPPARLFFGVITGFESLIDLLRELISARFGPLSPEEESPWFPFPDTRTYAKTMGEGPLHRKFLFLRAPWPQDRLAEVKRATIEIEDQVQASREFPVSRAVNIDPGLLNDCRIILASTKDHAHRLYRGQGIWEEITLVFRGGAYQPLEWTYRDFRSPEYAGYFAPIRARHLESLATLKPASEPRR